MTSNSRGEMTVQAINQALARRSVSLPELAEFARERDLPPLYTDHNWRLGRGFSRANMENARAIFEAEAGQQPDGYKTPGRGQPPPRISSPEHRKARDRTRPPRTAPQLGGRLVETIDPIWDRENARLTHSIPTPDDGQCHE